MIVALQTRTIEDLRDRVKAVEEEMRDLQAKLESLRAERDAIRTLLAQFPDPAAKQTRAGRIRAALKKVGKGSPKDVAEQMTKDGWDWNGSNPSSVVGVELNRMANLEDGKVQRVGRGVYRYVD